MPEEEDEALQAEDEVPQAEDEALQEDDDVPQEEDDVPQEEDEGRDSGGYYEEEEAEGEPYESQPASDSGHSMPDFTADVDIQKSDVVPEEEIKPEPTPEQNTETKQGVF